MSRTDSTPVNANAINSATEPVDRLNLISRWINAKMEEITQAEQRIEKRLEHLNATEQSLKGLFDSLRRQVTETQPVLKELATLRAGALNAVEQVVRATKDRSANSLQVTPVDNNGIDERIMARMLEFEEKVAVLTQAAEETIVKRIGDADSQLNTNLANVDHTIQQRLLSAQQSADAIGNRVMDQLNVAAGRANEIANLSRQNAQEAIDHVSKDFDNMIAPTQQRLGIQLEEMETRLSTDMANVEETMKAQLSGFYMHVNKTAQALDIQLGHLADEFRQQAEQVLASARLSVRQQIDSIEDEARLSIRPILHAIDERKAGADRHADAILAGMDDAMKIRLAELRRSGESIIQIVEAQLVEKLKSIRPQAQSAIEAAEKHVHQRLQMAMDNAKASVDLSEKQLADRIEELRPRISAAMTAARTDIDRHVASLESEANTATGWIEQRLNQRIDELTYRARKTVNDQIRELDDASQSLRRASNSERFDSTENLEVDVHVENPNAQRSTAA
jgi:hypothetical protein